MGTKYPGIASSGYNAGFPSDDGAQVASNLVTWAGVKTKLADPIKTLADAENTALVAALDLSARAISSPDTAIASDHWKTLQVTGSTTITLSSAASMGAGYEVGVFNAGVGVVTVTPGNAADTINGVSASVTVSIKGTKIFRTNQALTGYNVVGGYDPQTVTASTSVVTPLVTVSGSVNSGGASAVSGVGLTTKGIDGTTSYIAQQISSGTSGNGAFTQYSDGVTFNTSVGADPTTGDFSLYDGRFPGTAGTKRFSISRSTGAADITGGLTPNFTSAETAIAAPGTATNIAHGLGVVPRYYMVAMRNKTAELGYSIGDEPPVWLGNAMISADATNITINFQAQNILRKDTGVLAGFTLANWKYVARAMK